MNKTNFTEHDNVDRDVIKINKDSLLLRIANCKEYYTSLVAAPTFLGISVSLLIPGLLAEAFKTIEPVPGETIRTSLLVLGIVTLVLSGYFFIKWHRLRDTHEPRSIIESMIQNKAEPPKTKH